MTVLPEELTWMRELARERLGSRAVVLHPTVVETETGTRQDYLAVAACPAGVRDHTVGSETVLAARIQSGSTVTVLLPLYDDAGRSVPVAAEDRISVTVTDPVTRATSTTVLEVTGVVGRLTEWPILQRAVCVAMA